ncbi:hypothetical protein HDU92_000225, partial [Lobulomyces angularis]
VTSSFVMNMISRVSGVLAGSANYYALYKYTVILIVEKSKFQNYVAKSIFFSGISINLAYYILTSYTYYQQTYGATKPAAYLTNQADALSAGRDLVFACQGIQQYILVVKTLSNSVSQNLGKALKDKSTSLGVVMVSFGIIKLLISVTPINTITNYTPIFNWVLSIISFTYVGLFFLVIKPDMRNSDAERGSLIESTQSATKERTTILNQI